MFGCDAKGSAAYFFGGRTPFSALRLHIYTKFYFMIIILTICIILIFNCCDYPPHWNWNSTTDSMCLYYYYYYCILLPTTTICFKSAVRAAFLYVRYVCVCMRAPCGAILSKNKWKMIRIPKWSYINACTQKVLDTKCFERLLGKCIHLLKAGIRTYKFVDADIIVDEKNS